MLKERRNQIVEQTVRQAARKKVRRRVLALLSAVVLVLTTNQLIFFADTLERIEACGLAEHSHTAECYGSDGSLTCELPEHVHTDACYQERPKKAAEEAEEDVVAETDVELDDVSQELEAFELTDDAQALEPETAPEEAIETAAQSYRYIIGAQGAVYLRDIFAAVGLDADDDVEVGQVVDPSHPEGMIRIENTDAGTAIVPTRDFSEVELAVFAKDGIYTVSLLDAAPQAEPESEPEPIEVAETIEVATVEEPAESAEETVEAEPVETAIETQDEVLTDSEPKTEPAEEEQTLVGNDSEAVEPVEEQTEVAIVETVEREAAEVESEPTSEVADTTEGTSEADVESSPEALTVVEETPDETPAEDNEATGEISNEDEMTEEATDADDEGEVTEETTDDEVEATEETADADDEVEATEETADDEVEAVEASDTDTINRKIFHATYDLTESAAPFSLKAWIADAKAAETVVEDADDGEAAEVEPSENEVAEAEPLPVDEWQLTYDAEDIAIEAVENDWTVTPVRAFEATELSVDTGDAVFALTLLNQAAEDEIELTDDNAEAYVAEIDLTDAVAPFSLAGWMVQARPEDAETAPAEEWTLEYDSDVFAVELTDGDYSVMPLTDFAQAAFAVNAGEARYELTLLNWTAEVPELLTGEISVDVEGANYKLHISVPEEANLPADAMFKAVVVEDASYANAALNAVPTDGESMVLATFDLTIYDAEGRVLQPDVPLDVSVDFNDDLSKLTNVYVVHFPGTGAQPEPEVVEEPVPMLKAAPMRAKRAMTVLEDQGLEIEEEAVETEILSTQVIDATHDDNGVVSFQADSFSYYAVVGTIVQEYLSDSGVLYEVKVTYGPEAHIPEGAHLKITEFAEDSADYDYARRAVLADKLAKGESVDLSTFGLAALDISILDANDNEIEPDATVQVDIRIKGLPGVEDLSEIADTLEIQHHVEVSDGVVVEKVFDGSVEGSYKMETNDAIAAEGTAVDPNSVSDEDFAISDVIEEDVLETSFDTEVFSTFTITWNHNGNRTVTVHYVDESGNELNVTNTTPNSDRNDGYAYLIYDVDGYEYVRTDRVRSNGTTSSIRPEIYRSNSRWYYTTTTGTGNANWNELENGDTINVVYKKKTTPTQGGNPTLKPVSEGDKPEDPSILKESDPNGDGTANLSLSIIGHTKDREVEKLADVIVVMDVSGSMKYDLAGTKDGEGNEIEYGNNNPEQRLYQAKQAVNNLATELAKKKNSQGDPLVRMSLISFSNTANEVIGLTDLTTSGLSSYQTAVNGLNPDGGTNWEAALKLANQQAVDSGRATFVIFVTDGDPTFRLTRYGVTNSNLSGDISNSYYRAYGVFGAGSSDNQNRNYNAAVTQGQAIGSANKNLYTIGISNSVTKVQTFNTAANGKGAYIASNTAQLTQAFADIEAAIQAKMGISDIQMTDGITEMTQTVEKSGLTTTDGSFTYWKKAKDANSFVEWDPASEGCAEAEYDTASGAVKWNMGTNFMPEDGATYKVTWKVWPSQDAYDILAQCRNNPSYYDTLNDTQKAQITRTGTAPNYSYTLRTNEPGAGTTYKSATKSGSGITTEGDTKSLPFNVVDPLGLASSQISVRKVWDNQLDGREVTGSYTFPVKADGTAFGAGVELSSSQSPKWQNSYFISTGLMTTNPYVVYEKGHDYTVEEPEDLSYQWDFKSDVYHPMVIDNVTVNLVKVDTEAESDYTIDGKYYKKLSGAAVLTAVNERRSNLNISKTVVDEDGKHITDDQAFTFTVTVNEGHDAEVWLSAYDTNAGMTVMDSTIVTGTGVQYQASDGYFHAPSGTTLTLTLKDGWNYRFTNLSVGSTYSIEENSPVPDGYAFVSATATATNSATAGTVTGQKTEGTIDKSNSVYTAAYTNKYITKDVKVKKVNADGEQLAGAKFKLTKGDKTIKEFTSSDTELETISLGVGVYCLEETEAPANYQKIDDKIYFKVDGQGKVTLCDENGTAKTYPDIAEAAAGTDGVYVITVTNATKLTKVTVVKKVASALASDQAIPFDFTQEGLGTETTFQLAGEEQKDGDTVTVANSKEFADVAYGTKFSVTETEAPNFTTTAVVTAGEGATATTLNPDNDGKYTVDADDIVVTVTNTRKLGDFEFTKKGQDQTGAAIDLAGATFTLYTDIACQNALKLGTSITPVTATSGTDGKVKFTGIPVGVTFYMKETSAPAGYELSEKTYSVLLEEEIAGEDAAATTTTKATIKDISDTGAQPLSEIPNTPKLVTVILEKRGDTLSGPVLDGAVFDLYNSDYKTSSSSTPRATGLTTKDGGHVELGNLPVGEYWLVETQAPAGYNLLSKAVKVVVKADGQNLKVSYQQNAGLITVEPETVDGKTTYTVIVTNQSGYELPHTGGMGTTVFTAGGIALIALALFLLMKKRMAMND